jgi:hypothetical protein
MPELELAQPDKATNMAQYAALERAFLKFEVNIIISG